MKFCTLVIMGCIYLLIFSYQYILFYEHILNILFPERQTSSIFSMEKYLMTLCVTHIKENLQLHKRQQNY
jgi:hypothetical protein